MIRFLAADTAKLFKSATGDDWKTELLWGDRVEVLDSPGGRAKVRARGRTGFLSPGMLGDTSLLELYFIDVGQGDGVLIRTPDDRHVLIDGGWPRANQPIGKNAADFVDWKFKRDYGRDTIELDAMICSHNDQDHYGGLWDLLDPGQSDELDVSGVTIEEFYHAGLSWWRTPGGSRSLGPKANTSVGRLFTRLLGDRASLEADLAPGASPALQGEWAQFLRRVSEARRKDGQPTPVTRLSHVLGFLPGFDGADGQPAIHVLAPVEFEVGGQPAIRHFSGGDSINTNGNSVLLRIDYGRSRILLTGDLNTASQQSLLADYEGEHDELACDVAKACHHGSADVSLAFLAVMEPAATILSSGDSEGHDHPRPNIVAASGLTGFQTIAGDRLVTPLVYSTELARSVGIGHPTKLELLDDDGQPVATMSGGELFNARVTYRSVKAGDRNPSTSSRRLRFTKLAVDLIYGLVNVRTDGDRILCAVLNEKESRWNVETFHTRF